MRNTEYQYCFSKLWLIRGFNLLWPHDAYMNWVCIDTGSGLSLDRYQAIIWTNVALLPIEPFKVHSSKIMITIWTFSVKNMLFRMSPKCRTFYSGINVLIFSKHLEATTLIWHTMNIYLYHISHNASNIYTIVHLLWQKCAHLWHICAHFCCKVVHCGRWYW